MISHKHRFIFVHKAKTGGCSIEAIFGIGPVFHNPEQPGDARHMRLVEYKRLFPELYDDYFKFAFVRNPWDCMVSKYFQHRESVTQKLTSVDQAILATSLIEDAGKRSKKLAKLETRRAGRANNDGFLSFSDWISLIPRRRKLAHYQYFDFVGQFERLNEDFQTVCDRIGLKASLPHVNRSSHAHYTSYYDERTRSLVAERCAGDIERFGYRFGD